MTEWVDFVVLFFTSVLTFSFLAQLLFFLLIRGYFYFIILIFLCCIISVVQNYRFWKGFFPIFLI